MKEHTRIDIIVPAKDVAMLIILEVAQPKITGTGYGAAELALAVVSILMQWIGI